MLFRTAGSNDWDASGTVGDGRAGSVSAGIRQRGGGRRNDEKVIEHAPYTVPLPAITTRHRTFGKKESAMTTAGRKDTPRRAVSPATIEGLPDAAPSKAKPSRAREKDIYEC